MSVGRLDGTIIELVICEERSGVPSQTRTIISGTIRLVCYAKIDEDCFVFHY